MPTRSQTRKNLVKSVEKTPYKNSPLVDGDNDLFDNVLNSNKPKTAAKRNYNLANLTELEEEKGARSKKRKTPKKESKVDTVDDIEAMLMATEGKHCVSDKENAAPLKTKTKKKVIAKRTRRAKKDESDDDDFVDVKPSAKKKSNKKPVKKSKTKSAEGSDWSDSDGPGDDGLGKKRAVATEKEDGTIEIQFDAPKSHRKPQKVTSEEEWIAKAIKAAINKDKLNQARVQHKLNILCLMWYGMSWDGAADSATLHAKIISHFPLAQKAPTTAKSLTTFIDKFEAIFAHVSHYDKKSSGLPSPQCAKIALNQLVEGKGSPLYERICANYEKFGHFMRNVLLLAALRAFGCTARLVISFDLINHKPQSPNQIKATKEINKKRMNNTSTWLEVNCASSWFPVVSVDASFNVADIDTVEALMKWPMTYAVAFDRGVRDVTARYAADWLTETKKLRIKYTEKKSELNWWKMTCELFPSRNAHLEAAENAKLSAKVINQEIPSSLSKVKGHPIYVAARHILKYEIIWPGDTTPVSQIKVKDGFEDVFERKYVRPLHTRGTWLQKARLVREGEVPAKMVASWMQNKKQNKDKDYKGSALFGEWQVDHYEPPIATNGKVPRNDFGNVDLYQECMLPIGTTWIRHLEMGVFSRVCRKQQIDAAKAVVGFDGKKGYPVTEGYVICKEFEKQAMEAYYDQCGYDVERKEKERKTRIRKLWYKAYRGVLIQKKVQRMFNGVQVDPAIERIMMSKMHDEPAMTSSQASSSKQAASSSSKQAASSSSTQNSGKAKTKSSSNFDKGVKVEAESDIEEEEEEEEEAETNNDTGSSDEDQKPVKPTKAIQRRAAMPRRQAAKKASKFDFSSDSSDMSENSGDDYKMSG